MKYKKILEACKTFDDTINLYAKEIEPDNGHLLIEMQKIVQAHAPAIGKALTSKLNEEETKEFIQSLITIEGILSIVRKWDSLEEKSQND